MAQKAIANRRVELDSASDNYNVLDYGAVGDGVADDTAAINSAIAVVMGSGGGTLFFPTGTYKMLGAMIIPYTLNHAAPGTLPSQKTLRLIGAASSWQGYWTVVDPPMAAVLDMRYDGLDGLHPAKIDSRGAGLLEITSLMLKSGGSDVWPFIFTSNTTLYSHNNAFWGKNSQSGTTCTQDVHILGGLAGAIQSDEADAQFQGYGTRIEGNFYHKIRHAVLAGSEVNGIDIGCETISKTCGSATAIDAPYVFQAAVGASGNRITGGTIEITNYKYAVCFLGTNQMNFVNSLGIYDNTGYTVAAIYLAASANYNFFIMGYYDPALQSSPGYFDGAGASTNSVIGGGRYLLPSFSQGMVVNTLEAGTIQGNTLLKSAKASVPNGTHMVIDTGTGGSYLYTKAYSNRFQDQNGNTMAEIKAGLAKGTVMSGSGATGARPTAANAGAGGMWYDTTLVKPIWSDGTTWRDSAGSAV